MRQYAQNSPQAAARIIGLILIADGNVGHAELALLDELNVHHQLGLTRDELHAVINTFCEDLLCEKQLNGAGSCPLDEYTMAELMAEIDDHELRRKVLGLCVRLAEADDKVAEGESLVLKAAVGHWQMYHQMLLRWF